jgi:hypothetical protein
MLSLQVEQAPRERIREHACARVPVEGHGHELRLMTPPAQLLHEGLDEDLRPAPRERHLRVANDDAHG